MKFLWNNKVRRARSSLLWSISTAPIDPTVYPFLIIDAVNGSAISTSITAAGWDLDIVDAPAQRTINLISTPSGGTLNAFSSFEIPNNVNGDLALPPLPHTITTAGQIPTIFEGDGLYSITATTLKYVNFDGNDANNLQTLSLPALKGGNLRFTNTSLVDYGRTAFPAYVGNDATFGNFEIIVYADGITMDFPVMLKIQSIFAGANNVDPVYDCTMPLLNEVTRNIEITADTTSVISLPSLTNLGSGGLALASHLWGDAIDMPLALMPNNAGSSLTLGNATTGVSLFYLALTSMRTSSLYIYMQAFPSPFQIFATVQTAGTVGPIYIRFDAGFPSPLPNADTIWAHLDAKLPSGGTTTIAAPTPTLGAANVAYDNLVTKGYTCSFT